MTATQSSCTTTWLTAGSSASLPFPTIPAGRIISASPFPQTPDPTGAWYRYAFIVSNTKMNDYPHFGVWPDGYYMSVNQFTGGTSWGGAGVAVYERDKMLLGQTARQVYFDLFAVNSDYGGMLPSDLDGDPPPAGTPNFFAEVDDAAWIPPVDAMRIWEFHVDWDTTANSTFGVSGNPNHTLPVTGFTALCLSTRNCIPQSGTSQRLDAIGDRLMHRLQYRNFGGYETLVTNHTVDAGGGRAGVRWYDMRRTGGGAWSINQQGTYAGDAANTDHRWMGSAAMDAAGNIALGYSISSSARFPSIAYTGRLDGDPPNTLPQGEALLYAGAGSQTSTSARWGDYSMLGVDPLDDCTFWYTNEYLQTTGTALWRTRIGSFTFPSCLTGLSGSLTGNVTDGLNPIPNASVQTGGFSDATDASGDYTIPDLPVGTYTVTASAYGFTPISVTNVDIEFNTTTTQNFTLAPIPFVTVNGVVTDGSGQGWPLYARIDIAAPGYAETIFTDPVTGGYSVELASGVEHSFTVNAVVPGYTTLNAVVTPAVVEMTRNFSLQVDAGACSAPGYNLNVTCNPVPGGLLVGHVYDANTAAPLNDANVTSLAVPADTTATFATPADPAEADGLFVLFSSLTGNREFTAAKSNYGSQTESAVIVSGAAAGRDFNLPAARLQVSPTGLTEDLGATQVITRVVSLNNTGTLGADFSVDEVNAATDPLIPTGPYAHATRRTSPKRLADLDASAVYLYDPPGVPGLSGGALLSSWPSGLLRPWGLGLDAVTGDIWVGDAGVADVGGDESLQRFTSAGSATAQSIVTASQAQFWADLAYNPFMHTFWQVNVGGDNCVVEIDPAAGALTGGRICPPFDQSQRGLAYNPLNGSFYSGSWVSGILYHFDQNGVILDSVNTALNIAGLAFNPDTRHLFVLSNASTGYDVYVLDTQNGYAILGGFDIAGLESYQQAGLEMSCDGSLWGVNQGTGAIFAADSGESTACAYTDVAWLSVAPISGTVSAGGTQALLFTIDASQAPSGSSSSHVVVSNNTPYGALDIPVNLTVDSLYALSATTAAPAKIGAAGAAVTYAVQITNLGNSNDIFTISVNGNLWTVNYPAQAGPLAPDDNTTINVIVNIPAGAATGQSDNVNVRIASFSNPAVFTTVALTTRVSGISIYLPAIIR